MLTSKLTVLFLKLSQTLTHLFDKTVETCGGAKQLNPAPRPTPSFYFLLLLVIFYLSQLPTKLAALVCSNHFASFAFLFLANFQKSRFEPPELAAGENKSAIHRQLFAGISQRASQLIQKTAWRLMC